MILCKTYLFRRAFSSLMCRALAVIWGRAVPDFKARMTTQLMSIESAASVAGYPRQRTISFTGSVRVCARVCVRA